MYPQRRFAAFVVAVLFALLTVAHHNGRSSASAQVTPQEAIRRAGPVRAMPKPETFTRGPQLKWGSFRRRETDDPETYLLADNDVIRLKEEPNAVSPEEVEIALETPLNLRWWKGLEVRFYSKENPPLGLQHCGPDYCDQILNSLYTQDNDHGPKTMRVRISAIRARPHTLVFLKAKALGAHTEVYRLFLNDPARLAGRRLTFIWERD